MEYREILVNNGEKKQLMRIFNCSYPTVSSALKYRSKTLLAHKIRIAAIERGGMQAVIKGHQQEMKL